jgi:ribosomal protein S24E
MENFKILEEKKNSLFNRSEIKLSVEAEVNPSNAEAEKFISEKFSTPIENIKIKKILGKFGSKTFTILVNLYGSEEHKKGIESKSKKSKKGEKK